MSHIWSENWTVSKILLHLQVSKVASVWYPSCMIKTWNEDFYCFWKSAIAFLWPQSALSFMKFLANSRGSPRMYFISQVSLPLGSSILFLTDSWYIDMKFVNSSGFPSNGSISTCGADCCHNNFDSISAALSSSFTKGHPLLVHLS